MIKAFAKRRSIAVLLSGGEQFSSYYGGAIARWTYEVYSRSTDKLTLTVFGFPTAEKTAYPLPHETSEMWRACVMLARIPLLRRHEETLWLKALIRRIHRFDAVHIHNRPQWVAQLRQIGYRGAIVLHLHNDHLGHWSASALDALAPRLQSVVACSEYLKSTFASKSKLLREKTHLVFNGANLELFYPREEIREPKTILFVGRLDEQKGVLQLLKAYRRVLDFHPDTRLLIAGTTGFGAHSETPYVTEVRRFAQSLKLEKNADIRFTGYLDHDKELPLYFQRATVFAIPSLFQEPFGMVNAEAMACATAVVAANRGGIPEAIGNAGRLVNPEDAEEFAGQLSELLNNEQARRDLGRTGYERCLRMFDWRVIAQNWINLLDEVIPESMA